VNVRAVSSVANVGIDSDLAAITACSEMARALEREDAAAAFASSGRSDIAHQALDRNRAIFRDAFSRKAHDVAPGEGELLTELDNLHGEYSRAIDAMMTKPPIFRPTMYNTDLQPKNGALVELVEKLKRVRETHLRETGARAERTVATVVRLLLALGVLTVLSLACSGLLLFRSSPKPRGTANG
jgi:hypothetical protein